MLRQREYLKHVPKPDVLNAFFPPDLEAPIDLWSRQRVEEYQAQAVGHVLRHAYEHNAHYRAKFDAVGAIPSSFQRLADIERFPFTEKRELIGDPWRLLAVPREEICQVYVSTGTTSAGVGDHVYRLLSWHDVYVAEAAVRGFTSPLTPSKPGDVVAMALPYEMSSAGMACHRTYQYSAKAISVNVGKGGSHSTLLKTLYILKDLAADIVFSTPSHAVALYEAAAEAKIAMSELGPRLLYLTGEGCSNAFRQRIADLWGCPVLRFYGSLEGGAIGTECVFNSGFHVFESHVFVEIVDPDTGRACPEGVTGEVCLTVLNKTGAPLIRYRTQDLGHIDRRDCPCCLNAPRVFLRGRRQDQLAIGGKSFSPVYLEDVLYGVREIGNSYQLILRDGKLSLRVEWPRGGHRAPRLADAIRAQMSRVVGEVEEVELVERIPETGGKAQRVLRA